MSKRGIVTGCDFSGGSAGRPFVAAFAVFAVGADFDGAGDETGDADGDGAGVEAFDRLGVGEAETEASCACAAATDARQKAVVSAALKMIVIVFYLESFDARRVKNMSLFTQPAALAERF